MPFLYWQIRGEHDECISWVHELIGHTPIVEITRFSLPEGVRLFAKLEFYNPGGSVKDRLGRELIEDALEKGLLQRAEQLLNRQLEILVLDWHSQRYDMIYTLSFVYQRNLALKNKINESTRRNGRAYAD